VGRIGDWVVVANARDWIHANLMAGVLTEAGLAVRIGNEHLQGVLGDVPSDMASRPHVLVHARDAAWASEVLAELAEDIDEQRRSRIDTDPGHEDEQDR
jgi:hypothetical protein